MSQPRVAALYRHPVKGFTPESCETLTILGARVAGDRVLGVVLGDAKPRETVTGGEWWPKQQMVVLMNTPGLARLVLRYDEARLHLTLSLDDRVLADVGLDDAGRAQFAEAVVSFVRTLPEAIDLDVPGRLPLRLVGDGVTPRFQDRAGGFVTAHGRASLEALGVALADAALDERRFRSNIAIEGLDAWSELGWSGRVRIGGVEFKAERPVGRCLATHANPGDGVRDREVLTTLTRVIGQAEPQFGVLLTPTSEGTIRLGDAVEVG
ncbi:MAG: MOSC domain-containing protein [Dehalococcoidia bacterium]|nr:MAG: MOSC domain-containing protein [Dehalococcoidia bacterium]